MIQARFRSEVGFLLPPLFFRFDGDSHVTQMGIGVGEGPRSQSGTRTAQYIRVRLCLEMAKPPKGGGNKVIFVDSAEVERKKGMSPGRREECWSIEFVNGFAACMITD